MNSKINESKNPNETDNLNNNFDEQITEIIRKRIDMAIIHNDEKTAKQQLEILEKYQKIIRPPSHEKAPNFKERRRMRDELMNNLLKKFERLQNTK